MSERREKARAVFLTVVMVLSVFSMSASFAGSAAAAAEFKNIDTKNTFSDLQTAVDNASQGDTIEIQQNQTLSAPVNVTTPGITIRGATPRTNITLDGSDAGVSETANTLDINADGVTVRDLTVRRIGQSGRTGDSDIADAIVIRSRTGNDLSGVTIDNVGLVGKNLKDSPSSGLAVLDGTGSNPANVSRVTVRNSEVSGFDLGLTARAPFGKTVSDVAFLDNRITGYTAGVEVSTFNTSRKEEAGTVSNVTINNNDFVRLEGTSFVNPGVNYPQYPVREIGNNSDDSTITDTDEFEFDIVLNDNFFDQAVTARGGDGRDDTIMPFQTTQNADKQFGAPSAISIDSWILAVIAPNCLSAFWVVWNCMMVSSRP